MSESARWTCPACGKTVLSPFCPRCGEEPVPPRDLTLRGVTEKLAHALTNIDARVIHTLRLLLGHPGKLTLAWTRGVRRPYVAPFQLFLIANVIFLALQLLTRTNIFSSSLDSHLNQQDWSELAGALVAQRLSSTHRSLAQYAPVFDRAVMLNAKSLIVLMTLPFALLLPAMFFRARRPFMAHLAFSVHLYTFLLIVMCVGILAARLSASLGWGGLDSPRVDTVISIAILSVCTLYLYAAIGPVYEAKGPLRLFQAATLAVAVGAIVLAYRFVLFLVTLYGT